MADALIFEFGADITQFKGNIQQVIDQIKKVREEIKTAAAGDLPKLNAQLATLTDGLKRLKTVGTPAADGFKKVEDTAKGARVALTSVNQVVQDLPFGFIGIQNNLPALFSSFSKLNSSTEGIVGAFKNLDKATLITSGLFLAFNVATAAVTFLIQKYGSLGAAFDSLFGKTNLARKAQEDYNKAFAQAVGSTTLEYAEIVILTNALTDLNKPLKERQAAYVELKKISPDVVAGISEESIATGTYTTLLNDNAKAIIQLLKLKAEESAISNILTKNAEELATLKIEENKLVKEQVSAQRDLDKAKKEGILVLGAGRNADQLAIIAINNAAKSIKANQLEQNKLNKVADDYLKILDPTIKGIAEIDRRTKELNDTLKEQQKVTKPPKAPKPPRIPVEIKGRAGLFDYLVTEVDKSLIPISKLKGKLDDLLKPKISPFQLQTPNLKNPLQNQLDALKIFVQKSEEAKNQLKDFFFDPVNALFTNFFETGKFTIQAFGDVLLAQIKKIVAAELTKKLLSLLANLIPGVAAGSAALKAGSAIGSFLGAGGSLLGRGAANFSGIQGGGMGMSGSVNLTLRGTDLVGAINRTNTQISRVG